LIRLAASNPRGPPLSVVFTPWLSITAAEGWRQDIERRNSGLAADTLSHH
jgi:hypothetical protein